MGSQLCFLSASIILLVLQWQYMPGSIDDITVLRKSTFNQLHNVENHQWYRAGGSKRNWLKFNSSKCKIICLGNNSRASAVSSGFHNLKQQRILVRVHQRTSMSYQCNVAWEKGKCIPESIGVSVSHGESADIKAQDAHESFSSRVQLSVPVDTWRINSDLSRIGERPQGLAGNGELQSGGRLQVFVLMSARREKKRGIMTAVYEWIRGSTVGKETI